MTTAIQIPKRGISGQIYVLTQRLKRLREKQDKWLATSGHKRLQYYHVTMALQGELNYLHGLAVDLKNKWLKETEEERAYTSKLPQV